MYVCKANCYDIMLTKVSRKFRNLKKVYANLVISCEFWKVEKLVKILYN